MNLLCIAVDRLHVGYLGCYGSTWVATPTLDRLASGGFVFDSALVDVPDLAAVYDSLWRGTHAAERLGDSRTGAQATTPTFAEVVRRAGLKSLLMADDPAVFDHPAAAAFDDVLELAAPPPDAPTADEAEGTHAARTFADVIERLEDLTEPFAAWLHCGALGGSWDAPASFRERYRDEDDPPIPTFTQLASRTFPPDVDLDERFAVSLAYAGQVSLVDACLGALFEHLEESGLDRTTAVMVFGTRGLALGEHGEVGFHDQRLFAENVHVPWIVRLPDGRGQLRRSHALVQPCDLLPTVAALLGVSDEGSSGSRGFGGDLLSLIDGDVAALRDRAPMLTAGEIALRTPHWMLRAPAGPADDDSPAQLYVKPDDFWEVNDVADRCVEAVGDLRTCYAETLSALAAGEPLPPLPESERLLVDE